MELSLKSLEDADFATVAGLRLAPPQERFAGGSLETLFRSLRISRYSEAQHPFVIVSGDVPVGLFVLREPPALPEWAPRDVMTLHNFRIGRAHQRRGYGREGVRLAARWVFRNRPGVERLMLAVNARNSDAKALYLDCGFVDTERVHHGSLGAQNLLAGDLGQLA